MKFSRLSTSIFALLLSFGCASNPRGSSGQTATATPSSTAPNLIVTAPLPIPSSVAVSPQSGIAGSGVPLDAPVTDVPAADASSFLPLARGATTPLDRALAEGDDAYRRGDFVGARTAYEKAARLAPKDPAPMVGLVRTRLSAEHAPVDIAAAPGHAGLEQAAVDLQKAVRLDGTFAPALLELGRTFLVLGRMDEAVAHLRRGIDLAPKDAEMHSAFGVSLLATGVVETGLKEFQIAAGIESNSAVRFKNLGAAFLAAGKPADAVQALERAAQVAPKDARIQNDLGTALLTVGETDRALQHLQWAVQQDPRRATYRSNLGYAWAQKGDLERAIVIYREALALDERLGSAWINLGNAFAKQHKFDLAKDAYQKAQAIDPSDPRVQNVIEEMQSLERGNRSGPAVP